MIKTNDDVYRVFKEYKNVGIAFNMLKAVYGCALCTFKATGVGGIKMHISKRHKEVGY